MVSIRPVIILLAATLAACSSQKQAVRTAEAPAPMLPAMQLRVDPVSHRLDSLVAMSNGDYIHMQVSQCFGRCEGYASVFRESPAKYPIYEAEAWGYNDFDRADILYRLRKPIANDLADGIIEKAGKLGILNLVNDTTYAATDQPYIWVRARIGNRTVVVDHAYLGGESYMHRGLGETYASLRTLLFSLLYGTAPVVNDGK